MLRRGINRAQWMLLLLGASAAGCQGADSSRSTASANSESSATHPTEGSTGLENETDASTGVAPSSTNPDAASTASNSSPASTSGPAPSSTTEASGTTGDLGAEFCPPTLTPATEAWKAHYDLHFADSASMRSSLGSFPEGSGHWGQTYTLRSLVLMYELTGDLAYLHELIWQAEALSELAEDGATWPTGVCGNTFSHTTVVIDGRLLAPLLRAAWWMDTSRLADDPVPAIDDLDLGGTTYAELAASYVVLATEVLAGHESQLVTIGAESFGPEQGSSSLYYRFPASYECVASDVMPFNYANSAGTAYAELWRVSADLDAREHAEQLLTFWWSRTDAYEPTPGATRSRWWGYRGEVSGQFDPDDASLRAEDVGHADMSSSFAARMFELGLGSLNGTRIDQVAMTSKRWVDRTLSTGGAPSYAITNDDHDGDWDDLFDHLPMSCHRASILEDLTALAPTRLANDDGDYRRGNIENIAELAYYTEFSTSASPCGPVCGDGQCNGPEDCIGCPGDCGSCSAACR